MTTMSDRALLMGWVCSRRLMAPARQNPAKRKNKIGCIVNDPAKSSPYSSTSRHSLGDPNHTFIFIREHTEVQEYHGRKGVRGTRKTHIDDQNLHRAARHIRRL